MRRPWIMNALILSTFSVIALACAAASASPEVLVGGPCEGCEAVFEGRPAKLASKSRIAPATEPGEPMTIEGVVTAGAKPAAGVIVYAYHTDARGTYPKSPAGTKHRHGRLRGFAITDANGRYSFETIRPASYPETDIPQHVHMHVVEPGRCHYYIDDLVFTDDVRLTDAERKSHSRGRGGIGVATPTKRDGRWQARRDIALGAGVADYDRCRRR